MKSAGVLSGATDVRQDHVGLFGCPYSKAPAICVGS